MIDHFPPVICQEILFRLSPKCLIKCTLVSKSWRSMIKNQNFIRGHLSFNNRCGTPLLLLHCITRDSCHTYGYKVFINEDTPRHELYSLRHDNSAFHEYWAGGNIFVICNPLIRKLVTLPEPNISFESNNNATIGFGFDAATNDYKVVRLVPDDPKRKTFAEVYSLARGTWTDPRHVAGVSEMHACTPQAFVNGTLHWQAVRGPNGAGYHFILTFDVGSESFSEIMMPESFTSSMLMRFQSQLSVTGDGKSIALFSRCPDFFIPANGVLDIWVMKEYGMPESWTKLAAFRGIGPERSVLPKALGFMKTGKLVLELVNEDVCRWFWLYTCPGHGLFSMDLVSQNFNYLGISGYKYNTIDSYEKSLVLLDVDNAVSY
ncbi:F-box protein CPR1-like [Rosa rugosa]|uniref:F-box protein CPR1-like n=1 Tax=Rosa rugosa TaxID=74645 RepID=UPI002B40A729|nr:F-box protein CPR1-like [Rosa rugosa]